MSDSLAEGGGRMMANPSAKNQLGDRLIFEEPERASTKTVFAMFASHSNALLSRLGGAHRQRIASIGEGCHLVGQLLDAAFIARDSLATAAGKTVVVLSQYATVADQETRSLTDEAREAVIQAHADYTVALQRFNDIMSSLKNHLEQILSIDLTEPVGRFVKRRVAPGWQYLNAFQSLGTVAHETYQVLFESGRIVSAGYLAEQKKWGDLFLQG